ncbi:hypothetical protein G7046_g3751 [Stylonectria norvegica]|nr:hypothetical protein G7046_g3751 [Stylonectria norvegica]
MSFSFVAYDGPKAPLDASVRRLIRRQAMKETAAQRKQKRGYGQLNLRQYPIFLEESEQSEDLLHLQNAVSKKGNLLRRRNHQHSNENQFIETAQEKRQRVAVSTPDKPAFPVSSSPRDLVFAQRFSFLLQFMPLTGLRLGLKQLAQPKAESVYVGNSITTPYHGSRKLLSFILSRYDHASALSHATDCVVSKLQHMMQPSHGQSLNGESTVLFLYTKALRSLQAALDDEAQRTTAETLCATELLSMFEMMNGNPEPRQWMSHTSGAAHIIQARGAHHFQTDFEMALFSAHIGPTVMDSFLNNKPCFLAEERWKNVMRSAISSDDSLAEQQDLVLGLWAQLVDGPRKFMEVTRLINSPIPPPQKDIDDLIDMILADRHCLLSWGSKARTTQDCLDVKVEFCQGGTVIMWPTTESGIRTSQQLAQLSLWGTYILCRILKSRLLVSLSSSRFHSLEAECQDLAARVVDLNQTLMKSEDERLLDQLFISQSIWVAKGIAETKEIWGESEETKGGMIEKWKFHAWCKAIGRPI